MKQIIALVVFLVLLTATIIGVGLYKVQFQQSSPAKPKISSNQLKPAPSGSPLQISAANIPLNLPSGYTLGYFAKNLGTPRDFQFSPGGTLLVSDPSDGAVLALPDKNSDGVADQTETVISGLNHPHGLAFYGNKLFIAEVDRVARYNWDEKTMKATLDKVLFSLPENSDHNSRTLTFDGAGNLYVSVGSTCNVCHESSSQSGTVMISNSNGDNPRIYASGLRNAAFIQINPKTGQLWGTEMGRDYLGDNIPPDEINIIREGQNYGWPNCYGDKIPDTDFNPGASASSCANTASPIYQIPAHSAPLGLVFINSPQFPPDWQGDLLVSYHGSWNRSVPTGYKVVHMKVSGNQISGVEDFITGFQTGTVGRPVDLTFDKRGNLYLSDDKSGNVYIIVKS